MWKNKSPSKDEISYHNAVESLILFKEDHTRLLKLLVRLEEGGVPV